MRALILIAVTALSLAACRNNDQTGNTGNVDESLTAGSIVSNDVTAIDAVTGADANMAADVNYIPEVDNSLPTEGGTTAEAAIRPPSRAPSPSNVATNQSAPAANTTAPVAATSNNAL